MHVSCQIIVKFLILSAQLLLAMSVLALITKLTLARVSELETYLLLIDRWFCDANYD